MNKALVAVAAIFAREFLFKIKKLVSEFLLRTLNDPDGDGDNKSAKQPSSSDGNDDNEDDNDDDGKPLQPSSSSYYSVGVGVILLSIVYSILTDFYW